MTAEELETEWKYRYEERLGIMCGSEEPNDDQLILAMAEADEAIEKIKDCRNGAGENGE